MKKARTFFSNRDLRRQLRGYFIEGDAECTIRYVSATACCKRCGGKLDIRTLPMSDRLVEECPRCGISMPVQRFAPMEEHATRVPSMMLGSGTASVILAAGSRSSNATAKQQEA